MLGAPPAIEHLAAGTELEAGRDAPPAVGMLSETLARPADTPSGSGDEHVVGERDPDEVREDPPQSPPNEPKPYMESDGTLSQSPVCPRRHGRTAARIWNGTLRAPRGTAPSAASTTSATHSWPIAIGGEGASPGGSAARGRTGPRRAGAPAHRAHPGAPGSSTSHHSKRRGSITSAAHPPTVLRRVAALRTHVPLTSPRRVSMWFAWLSSVERRVSDRGECCSS